MLRLVIGFAAAVVLLSAPARAAVVVTVDKTVQRLTVDVDGVTRYQWPVSTARQGFSTPNGTYKPERLARKWFSRKYHWSPMPYSIFFNEGYAIHGSYEISRLGSPASHGCIRLRPDNAALLFALVQANESDTRIVVAGDRPTPELSAHKRLPRMHAEVRRVQLEAKRGPDGFANFFNATPNGGMTDERAARYW